MEINQYRNVLVASKSTQYDTIKKYIEELRDSSMQEIVNTNYPNGLLIIKGRLEAYAQMLNVAETMQQFLAYAAQGNVE